MNIKFIMNMYNENRLYVALTKRLLWITPTK